jgi:predicted GIY-YIG superfamily endonuclease
VISNLVLRIHQHRSNVVVGFVQDYGIHRLVFAEFHDTALLREKAAQEVAARGNSIDRAS